MWYSRSGHYTGIQSLPTLRSATLCSLQDSRIPMPWTTFKAIHNILESLFEKFDAPVNEAWLMFNFYKFCTIMTEMLLFQKFRKTNQVYLLNKLLWITEGFLISCIPPTWLFFSWLNSSMVCSVQTVSWPLAGGWQRGSSFSQVSVRILILSWLSGERMEGK